MSAALKSHSIGATMVLTISHPGTHNALVPEICAAAVEAINAADTNPEVHSLVLVGEGHDFCSGGPMQAMTGQHTPPAQAWTDLQADGLESLHSWIESMRSCSKPVIAAIEGQCFNTGFSLALACDFLIASHESVYAIDQVTSGLSPQGGSSWALARALPRATAMQLLMLGDRLSAERLASLGLINQLCEPTQALSQALSMSQRLNLLPAKTLASIKELANDAQDHSLSAHLKQERDHALRQRLRWGRAGGAVH